MPSAPDTSIVILGAGVTGLTTATEYLHRYPLTPGSSISIVAKYLPGDYSPGEYCSAWAGANWVSFEGDGSSPFAAYDAVAYKRFGRIAKEYPDSGVRVFPMRLIYDDDNLGLEGESSKRKWYEQLVGGARDIPEAELPLGAKWGQELSTFMFNPIVYLMWLQTRLLKAGVKIIRRSYDHIDNVFDDFPTATTVFNCTGLGARNLGGVADENVYPTKGQTILLAEPTTPIDKTYIFSTTKFGPNEFSHVFPRPLGGGIIIGGVRLDNDWDTTPDMDRAERIKKRACDLCPQLGKPEDLPVVSHNVGLRPSRKGGVRIEAERRKGKLLIHSYGAGGGGYQSSWGFAERAMEVFAAQASNLTANL